MSDTNRIGSQRRPGFTLIELLVVVGIIGLLIAILVPSVWRVKVAAKDTTTMALLKNIETGVELFRTNYEKYYRASNGYPPSHAGPDINEADPLNPDLLYGAQWLPRYLVGKDSQGFVPPTAVPSQLKDQPEKWYEPDPHEDGSGPLERDALMVSLQGDELVPTNELSVGRGPDSQLMSDEITAPVFVDAFGFAVLYYAANPYGKVIAQPALDTFAEDAPGKKGIYVHQDNWGFTGSGDPEDDYETGMEYVGLPHDIAKFGEILPDEIDDEPKSFTAYIHDERLHERTGADDPTKGVVRPFRGDSYLLITAGEDGIYGTKDDINNFERNR